MNREKYLEEYADYSDEEINDIPIDRYRRITGYLVGTLDRWNAAKQAEEHDRVKHKTQ